ncbi:hypothetical protein Tco_0524015 [Tanacetum coccineum]
MMWFIVLLSNVKEVNFILDQKEQGHLAEFQGSTSLYSSRVRLARASSHGAVCSMEVNVKSARAAIKTSDVKLLYESGLCVNVGLSSSRAVDV